MTQEIAREALSRERAEATTARNRRRLSRSHEEFPQVWCGVPRSEEDLAAVSLQPLARRARAEEGLNYRLALDPPSPGLHRRLVCDELCSLSDETTRILEAAETGSDEGRRA